MAIFAAALWALLLLALTLQDASEVMLLPRRVLRQLRFVSFFYRVTWGAWSALASCLRNGLREHFLSVYGALSMVLLFGLWINRFDTGLWPTALGRADRLRGDASADPRQSALHERRDLLHPGLWRPCAAHQDRASAFGSRSRHGPWLYRGRHWLSAGAVQALLAPRGIGDQAGRASRLATHSPRPVAAPWRRGRLVQIGVLLREWAWGSELLESHLFYPMLAYYWSQHNDQSWLSALAVILDCCTLILVGLEGVPPLQARMTFTMVRQILIEMAQSFRVAPSRYTGGDRLDHPAFLRLRSDLVEAGFS
jgi:hypothetical protein